MWEWSLELQARLDQLSPQQQRAILMIVMAEVKGEPITRLLKTPYSCRWCGRVVGHSADGKLARKAELAVHELTCERGPALRPGGHAAPWRFATSLVTFYTRWKLPGSLFEQCLILARSEVRSNALQRAAWILQMGAPEAAVELRRQVTEARDDKDRRLASVAILNRVNLGDVGEEGARGSDDLDDLDDNELRDEEERLARILAQQGAAPAAGPPAAGDPEAPGPDQ